MEGAGTRVIVASMAKPGVNFSTFGNCKITGAPCAPTLVTEEWFPAAAANQTAGPVPAALAASQLFCTQGGVIFVEDALATTIVLSAEADPLVDDTSPLDGDGNFDAEDIQKMIFDPSNFLDWLSLVPVGGWMLKAVKGAAKINKARKLISRLQRIKDAMTRVRRLTQFRLAARHSAGASRAALHGKSWKKVSLKDTISKIAGPSPKVTRRGGKIIYKNPENGSEVVSDVGGKYFRINDPSLPGKRTYLDSDGNRIPSNAKEIKPDGRVVERGRRRDEYEELSHFTNSD